VLQCVAAHLANYYSARIGKIESMQQYFVVCCSVLQRVVLTTEQKQQCVAVCCSVLQCVAVCCSVLQCVAVCCGVLQRVLLTITL